MFTEQARTALLDGVAATALAPAGRIRRRGRTRARNQVIAGTVAAVLLVVGAGAVFARPAADPRPAPPAVVSTPATVSVTASVPTTVSSPPAGSGTPSAAPTVVPDAAMLQADDLGGATPNAADAGDFQQVGTVPPRPCGFGDPADAGRTGDRMIRALYDVGGRPNVVVEYVARYPDDGAAAYLTALRAALAGCAGWTNLGTAGAGDDSVLLRHRMTANYGGPDTTLDHYVAVVRIGRAIVVLANLGWEISSGDAATLRILAPVAVTRARPIA